jgi:hypothetical protein
MGLVVVNFVLTAVNRNRLTGVNKQEMFRGGFGVRISANVDKCQSTAGTMREEDIF